MMKSDLFLIALTVRVGLSICRSAIRLPTYATRVGCYASHGLWIKRFDISRVASSPRTTSLASDLDPGKHGGLVLSSESSQRRNRSTYTYQKPSSLPLGNSIVHEHDISSRLLNFRPVVVVCPVAGNEAIRTWKPALICVVPEEKLFAKKR